MNDDAKTELQEFTEATIEALYFVDTGDDGQPSNDAEMSDETRLDLEADCRSFWHRFGCFIMCDACVIVRGSGEYTKAQQAGHDFWMTRNGHGVGFWDGDWSDNYSDMLTKGAKAYGRFEIYAGDDGLIYA